MNNAIAIPAVSVTYTQAGTSTRVNKLGMRPMQERAYQKRGEQYLLIKSPPASGKSRALMFIALDKLENQGLQQAIIVVPEKSIGASFHNEPLSQFGFWADWQVVPKWNLCDAPGTDGGKVDAVRNFLDSNAKVLVCTHATFRFAVDKFGVEALDNRLIAVDEVEHIIEELGEWQGTDPATGFQLVQTADGTVLKIADLVDDDPSKRDKVTASLKDPSQKNKRDRVDIIIALGMAKEGFDWIWCEHALTIGYRSSLTEIVQIIGRATRDAPGKTRARFTNLIAEPDASETAVTEAVNDTLKAIAASLLMEQVLAPRFEFKPKNPNNQPIPGFDYGEGGYDPQGCNVGVNAETGQIQLEIKGLATPKSQEAQRVCREDLTELVTAFVQDKPTIERGLFDEELVPEELTQVRMGKIIKEKFPEFEQEDQETIRQHAIAALNLVQQAKQTVNEKGGTYNVNSSNGEGTKNTALIDGIRQFALSVTELDMDLIDRINPFGEAYAILAKSMSEERLKQVAAVIAAKRVSLSVDEARELAQRAVRFKQERGRLPSLTATDPWEKRMAEGVAFLQRKVKEENNA